jgi:hypothetical protein
MKKIMLTLAAVLCCAMISTAFTACNNENESVSDFAKYAVKVKYKTSIYSNCYEIADQMEEALVKALGDENLVAKRDDSKVIGICDEIFHNADPSGTFAIELQVTPFGNGLDNKTIVIKTYTN